MASLHLKLLQRWTGLFYEKTLLQDLGLVIQLGHHGPSCPIRKMTQDLARLGQLCQVMPSHAKSPKHAKCTNYVVLGQKKDAAAKSAPRHPNSTDLANFRDLAKTAKTSNVTSK